MNWHMVMTFFIAMIAITNPIGNLAIFISLVSGSSVKEQKKTALGASVAILIIFILVVWTGSLILAFFGITASAFETAGGIIILLLGISMLNAHNNQSGHSSMHHTDEEQKAAKKKDSVAVVPMAIPLVAGPGAITTIIIHTHIMKTVIDKLIISGICVVLAVIIGVCFYFANVINKVVGVNGIKIATRIMGIVLSAIAVQMLAEGIVGLFAGRF